MISDILTSLNKAYNVLGVYRVVYLLIVILTVYTLVYENSNIYDDSSIAVFIFLGFPLYLFTLTLIIYDSIKIYLIFIFLVTNIAMLYIGM